MTDRLLRSRLLRWLVPALLLSAMLGLASGCGGFAEVEVNNQTGNTILYLYISPCTDSTWGADQLGADTIASGSSFVVTRIRPDCYDMRAEDDGGFAYEDFGTELYRNDHFVWTLF